MPSEDLGIEVHPAWTGGWISRCGHVPSQIFLTNSRTWFTDHTGKTRWWRGVFEGDDSFCRLFPASVVGDTFPTEFLARWERYGHRMKLILFGSSGEFCGTQYPWNQRRLFQSLLIIHLLLQLQRVLKRPENANGLLDSITDGKFDGRFVPDVAFQDLGKLLGSAMSALVAALQSGSNAWVTVFVAACAIG